MAEEQGPARVARTAALASAVTIVGLLMARASGVMGCSERPSVGAEPRGAQAPSTATADAPPSALAAASGNAPSAEAAAPSAAVPGPTGEPSPAGLLDAPNPAGDNRNNPRFFPASKAGPVFVPNDVPSPQQAAPPQPPPQKNPNPR